MLSNIITSQDFLDEEIVAAKLASEDFEIFVSPEFEYDGQTFRVLLDGHHSLAAAIEAGVDPDVTEYTASQHDAISWLGRDRVEDFLEIVHMGSSWRFAVSGASVW